MNKTFSKFLQDNPDFWNEYTNYPEAVKDIINDWFYYRELCVNSDMKFKRMFGRKLNILEEQFKNMYDKYMGIYDITPDMLEVIDRTLTRVKSDTIYDTITRSINGTSGNTRTLDTDTSKTGTEGTAATGTVTNALEDLRTLNSKVAKTGTEEVDTTEGGTVGDSGSRNELTERSDYPQSSPTTGFENYLSAAQRITASSSNTQTINKTGSHDTTYDTEEANTGTIKDEHSGTVDTSDNATTTFNTTVAEDGTITDAGTLSRSEDESKNRTNTGNGQDNEAVTKRGNCVELFEKYFNLVKRTNAIEWLLNKLDSCFIQVFEEDEEEATSGGGGASSEEIAELEARVTALASTVNNILEGKEGVYRIFYSYGEMELAFNNGELPIGSTSYVMYDNSVELPYIDDGTGENPTQLKFKKSADAADYTTIWVTVGSTLERLSPQYNSALYTYLAQFYDLPTTLTDIYDHYELRNMYDSVVYPYYAYDPDSTFYKAAIDFEASPNSPGSNNNTYWKVDTTNTLVKLEV